MVQLSKEIQPSLDRISRAPKKTAEVRQQFGPGSTEQQQAFEKIKTALTTLPVLMYFDKDKDHIIQTDASKIGLGAVLLQEGQPPLHPEP